MLCCPWSHGLQPKKKKKNFKLVWRCYHLLSGFLAKGHLPRGSRQSLMIRVIMKWSWGCVHISWHLPYSWGKPQKTSVRRQSDEGAVQPVIASFGVPFYQMRSVGLHSTSGGKGRDGDGLIVLIWILEKNSLYKPKWKNHVGRMSRTRLPRIT